MLKLVKAVFNAVCLAHSSMCDFSAPLYESLSALGLTGKAFHSCDDIIVESARCDGC